MTETKLLITPERFLKLVNVSSQRQLAIALHRKLQESYLPPQPGNHGPCGPSHYQNAFSREWDALQYLAMTQSRLELHAAELEDIREDSTPYVLPPIMLLAKQKFLWQLDQVILVAFAEGPIIPAVPSKYIKDPGLLDLLILLYETTSADYMTDKTLVSTLRPDLAAEFATKTELAANPAAQDELDCKH